MGRPAAIEWPDKAKICVTFIVPWEVWPENLARTNHYSDRAAPRFHRRRRRLSKIWRSSPNENTATASVSGESVISSSAITSK